MKTTTRATPERHAGAPPRPAASRLGPWAAAAAVTGAVAVAVLAFYLWIYPSKVLTVPLGWDTARYLWRTTLARSVGLAGMQDAVPAFVNADPARPAFPVVAGVLTSLFRVSGFRLAAVLPSVTAAAVGLAAGAFVCAVLRRSAWDLLVVAFAVSTSAFMVRMLSPESYQDNLFAAAVFTAAGVPIAVALRDRRALLPAILLFGAGGVIHWAFFAFMLATVVVAALALAPGSWRAWRYGRAPLEATPSARLATVAAGGTALAGVVIYGVLGAAARSPRLSESEFAKKLARDLPKYRFPATLPLAAVGAWSLAAGRGAGPDRGPAAGGRRFVLVYLLSWAAVAATGYVAFEVLGVNLPAHRFLAFSLAVPLLAVLGVLWLGRLVGRAWRPLGVVVVAGLVGLGAWASHQTWFRTEPWITPLKTQQAADAARYLEVAGIGEDRPIVFVLVDRDASYVALMTHMLRAVLPAERIEQAHFYAGAPEDYLARRATDDPTGRPGALSARYLASIEDTYGRGAVALILEFFNDRHYRAWAEEHPESVVGSGVAVVRGPTLAAPLAPVPSPAAGYPMWRLGALAAGSLAVLWVVGLGWALALLGPWVRPLDAAAVAPAVGIAALVVGGVLLDRLGIRLDAAGGPVTAGLVAAGGWALAAARRRRAGAGSRAPS